jgi:transcriptional regulator with XRE-family HTH domain
MSNGRLNGKLITEHRKKTKASYGTMAAEIGVSTGMIRQMEEGYYPRRNADEIIQALANILGCSVGALIIPSEATKAS